MDLEKISRNFPRIAIVGLTGAVGQEMVAILNQAFQRPTRPSGMFQEIRGFSSSRNAGREVSVCGHNVKAQVLSPGCFRGVNLVFFDASDAVSKEWVPEALSAGAWVIDHSGVHRMDDEVVLGLPGVNDTQIREAFQKGSRGQSRKLISGPNCSTAGMVMALSPLHRAYGLKRVLVSTYQSVSGAGAKALQSLIITTDAAIQNVDDVDNCVDKYVESSEMGSPIAFSVIPKIGGIKETRFTSEEEKIREETRKILGLSRLPVSATAIRVPTLRGHAGSTYVELDDVPGESRAKSISAIREVLKNAPGISLKDGDEAVDLPRNCDVHGHDATVVGRLRQDPDFENGFWFFWASDNLRKGAALNALQIAEILG